MTRQINVLDRQPDVLLLVLPHIENKLAQELLQESYAASLSEHHGYVTYNCFLLENSFGAQNLVSKRDKNPTPQISRYDNH
jgi:hypothetical protein